MTQASPRRKKKATAEDRRSPDFSGDSGAIKFTPVGGRTTVSTRLSRDPLRIIERETCAGISKADIPRTLPRFSHIGTCLARKYEGSGPDLAHSKQRIELHGGTPAIESEPDEGTAVALTLLPERAVNSRRAQVA